MKIFRQDPGFGPAYHFCDLLHVCLAKLLHALEMPHKSLCGDSADTLYGVKLAHKLPLRPAVAVMCDPETVGLVTQGLHNPEARTHLVYIQRKRVARKLNLLNTLGNTDKSHLSPDTHFIERLHSRAELTLSAIDHHQLRQFLTLSHHS